MVPMPGESINSFITLYIIYVVYISVLVENLFHCARALKYNALSSMPKILSIIKFMIFVSSCLPYEGYFFTEVSRQWDNNTVTIAGKPTKICGILGLTDY